MASTAEMIVGAVDGLTGEVPALKKLKLVFGLDIRAKGDVILQPYASILAREPGSDIYVEADGVLHVDRHVLERDAPPRGLTEAADLGDAVGVVHDGCLARRDLIGIGHRGEYDREREGTDTDHGQGEEGEEDPPEPVLLAGLLRLVGHGASA